jgi:PPOX class probable F420-dependent enzyme
MAQLTPDVRAFLLHATRTGKLATVRPDGRPHVVPIWFVLDDDMLLFTTWHATVKATNIRSNSYVSLCVDDENPPFAYAMLEGTATLVDDQEQLKLWATRIAARYMGSDLAEAYGNRNAVPGELVVRVILNKVIFKDKVAD